MSLSTSKHKHTHHLCLQNICVFGGSVPVQLQTPMLIIGKCVALILKLSEISKSPCLTQNTSPELILSSSAYTQSVRDTGVRFKNPLSKNPPKLIPNHLRKNINILLQSLLQPVLSTSPHHPSLIPLPTSIHPTNEKQIDFYHFTFLCLIDALPLQRDNSHPVVAVTEKLSQRTLMLWVARKLGMFWFTQIQYLSPLEWGLFES